MRVQVRRVQACVQHLAHLRRQLFVDPDAAEHYLARQLSHAHRKRRLADQHQMHADIKRWIFPCQPHSVVIEAPLPNYGQTTLKVQAQQLGLRAIAYSEGYRHSAAVSEIIGPAGNDMHTLPPTVDAFQILNDARKESQHCFNSGNAVHSAGIAVWPPLW